MHKFILLCAFSFPVLVSDEVLEPSVQNEVDHAVSMAETALAGSTNTLSAVEGDVFGTNGLTATAIALKLVSSQGSDGRWHSGTNDVTAAAVEILRSVSAAPVGETDR